MIIGIDGNEANVRQKVGSNQYAFELLWALYKLSNPHQWVIYLRGKPLPNMPKSRSGWSYRVFGPQKLWTQWRLPVDLYLHRPQPDIFFSPGHYAPRWLPMPSVVSIMDLGYLKFPEQFTKRDLYRLNNWTAHSIKKAAHILTISQITKNDIMKAYGVPEDKITVTYPGYNEERFNAKVKERENKRVKEKYKISGDYILFLSTLKPSKNVEGLLEAFKMLGIRNLELVIAGKKGWMYETIFSRVKSLNLSNKVVFTDFVPEEEVSTLMAGAKVFVLPSFWEGFGIPVVEAMACGVPVVVSRAGSLPEIVGEAGIIVDPYKPEAIAQGIGQALEQEDELRGRGLEQVKKFSWEDCARKTLAVLKGVK